MHQNDKTIGVTHETYRKLSVIKHRWAVEQNKDVSFDRLLNMLADRSRIGIYSFPGNVAKYLWRYNCR